MENLTTKELILDLSTDLSRIGLFALQNNENRVQQFMKLSREAVAELTKRKLHPGFVWVIKQIHILTTEYHTSRVTPKELADDAFTYSNILIHRSGLI